MGRGTTGQDCPRQQGGGGGLDLHLSGNVDGVFLQIGFLLNPGFMQTRILPHGIWDLAFSANWGKELE